jgi:hypothetical protein
MTEAGASTLYEPSDKERDERRGAFSIGNEISDAGLSSFTLIPFSIRMVLITPAHAGSASRGSTVHDLHIHHAPDDLLPCHTNLKLGGVPLSWDQGPNLFGQRSAERACY